MDTPALARPARPFTMSQETPEQRIWKLEQGQGRIERAIERLTSAYEGNGQPGMKDQLSDIKREMRNLNSLTETITALERSAVRNAQYDALVGRVETLEDDKTKGEGFKLGRAGVIGTVTAVLGVLVALGAIAVQLTTLSSRLTGGP